MNGAAARGAHVGRKPQREHLDARPRRDLSEDRLPLVELLPGLRLHGAHVLDPLRGGDGQQAAVGGELRHRAGAVGLVLLVVLAVGPEAREHAQLRLGHLRGWV